MDNIHEMPKQHSQKIPQTTYTKLPPNSFKDSNGLIEGLLGGLFLSVKTRKRTRKIRGEDKDGIPKFQHNSLLEN